jgi:hypothetical protein
MCKEFRQPGALENVLLQRKVQESLRGDHSSCARIHYVLNRCDGGARHRIFTHGGIFMCQYPRDTPD